MDKLREVDKNMYFYRSSQFGFDPKNIYTSNGCDRDFFKIFEET